MPKVEKVTVSLPSALLAYVEGERTRTGSTRSETIAVMIRQARQAAELVERQERYAAAYAEQPETKEEGALGYGLSAQAFESAGDDWRDVAPRATPPGPTSRQGTRARKTARRAAR